MESNYLEDVKKLFRYYQSLGEKALAQIGDAAMFRQAHADSNSIAVIIKHLHGNMISRWTDFLNSDGEKPWRVRDAEFENDIEERTELLTRWNEGWKCLFEALDSLTPEDLHKTIYIRNEGHTVLEAINRQLTHYAYHVGQIVYIAKMHAGGEWKSLSVPRGGSKTFNAAKFNKKKEKRHFTKE